MDNSGARHELPRSSGFGSFHHRSWALRSPHADVQRIDLRRLYTCFLQQSPQKTSGLHMSCDLSAVNEGLDAASAGRQLASSNLSWDAMACLDIFLAIASGDLTKCLY